MQPDWEDLRHFAALARALNLARAANEIGTSQVTVMRRVRALEAALGTPLFVRRRDGHRLTRAGEEFAAALAPAAEHIEGGLNRLVARHASGQDRVRIVTTEIVANWILVPRLAGFAPGRPPVRLSIEASSAARSLTEDAETLAIRFTRPERGPYVLRKLGSIRFALYACAGQTPGTYIGWSGETRPASLSHWLRDAHDGREPTLALNTMAGHVAAARQGLGAAALPVFIGAREASLTRLDTPPPLTLDAWLVVPESLAGTARSKRVTQWIAQAFRDIPGP